MSGTTVPEQTTPDLLDRRWWHGVVDLEALPEGAVRTWRYPYQDRRYDIGISWGSVPAGARIAFTTTATRMHLELLPDTTISDTPCPVDIVIDGDHAHRLPSDQPATVDLPTAPGKPVTVEIWLPQYGCTGVRCLALVGDDTPEPVAPHTRRWTTHGSSITMNRQADGPYTTWPARVATSLGLELTNLGYAGTAVFDHPVARLIGALPADVISLCLGINVHHMLTHDLRSLLPAVMGFVETVRDGQPDTPILVISPIACRPQRDVPNDLGLSISGIRDAVHDGVERVQQATGDTNLHLLDGRELLGPDDLDLLVDDVHPGDAGCAQMAERIMPRLASLLDQLA